MTILPNYFEFLGQILDPKTLNAQHFTRSHLVNLVDQLRTARLQDDTVEFLTAISMGLNPADVPLRRYLPLDIYVEAETDEQKVEAQQAIVEIVSILREFDFEIDVVVPYEDGSVRFRPRMYTESRLTLKQLEERQALFEQAVAEQAQKEGLIDPAMRAAELRKITAETHNLNADTLDKLMSAAKKLVHIIGAVAAGVTLSLTLGSIRITAHPQPTDKSKAAISVSIGDAAEAHARHINPHSATHLPKSPKSP